MKKFAFAGVLAAAALSVAAAAYYFLGTTPGVRATLGAVFDRLDAPVEWGEVRSTGFGRFDADGVRAVFSEAVAEAETSSNTARLRVLPAAVQIDSDLKNVRVSPTREALGGRELVFAEGSLVATFHASGAAEYQFDNWKSPELALDGEVEMDSEGRPTRARVKGQADLALLGAMFFKKEANGAGALRVPFDVKFESGMLEVQVSGKPWLRSRWTMRR